MKDDLLLAETSTKLTYTTVHEQFSVGQQVIGFWFLGSVVPIVFHVKNNRGGYDEAILTQGDPHHPYIPYEDYGIDRDECLKILTFNVRHFYKCYLPTSLNDNGVIATPYRLNRCDLCDVSLIGCKNDVVAAMTSREYRVNRFIRKTEKTLQNDNPDPKGLRMPKGAC